jgi:NAD(P)-dependent dehydrogenase (short-subunit alcohol dehydrogenase family)
MSTQRSDFDRNPRKALVTGATSRTGRAVTTPLARDGLYMIVVGQTPHAAPRPSVRSLPRGQARFVGADFNEPAEIQRLAHEVGDIDVLVNNAGHGVGTGSLNRGTA